MNAIHHGRFERQKKLEGLLPPPGSASSVCLDAQQILRRLADDYGEGNASARLRAVQRDLKALVEQARIEAVDPAVKPLRYRRQREDITDDEAIWTYTLEQMRALIGSLIPTRQLERLWSHLPTIPDFPVLDESWLRFLPDTVRLLPPVLEQDALAAVISALIKQRALDVCYTNAEGETTSARIHPQALIQRGPLPYLFALKNDEPAPVRLYALHRLRSAKLLEDVERRRAVHFDLEQAIASGHADFGSGECILLELRVRGYLADVLEACPLNAEQVWEAEPAESEFKARVRAPVPSTGQLLRWLLGAGPNLEVVAPLALRDVVAGQAAKTVALYGRAADTEHSDGRSTLEVG